jgi:hypothetical protein
VTRLRKMMLEELERRNYSEGTTRHYLLVADTSHWLMIAAGENSRKLYLTTGPGVEYDSTRRGLPFSIDRCRFRPTRMYAFATLLLRMTY